METTINIHVDILLRLKRVAIRQGIPCSKLIIILMKKIMNSVFNPACIGKLVQYQVRSMPDEWHTFHITLRPDDYEYLLDLRKLLKMSVSAILALAVKKYLDKLNEKRITDKNHYKNYVIVGRVYNHVKYWKLIWGYPKRIRKIL